MTRVHRLQHVERFFTAYFTDDDAVRTHAQTVDQQLLCRTAPLPSTFGGLVSRRTTFSCGSEVPPRPRWLPVVQSLECTWKHVEERGLACAGAARNQNADLRLTAACKTSSISGRDTFQPRGCPPSAACPETADRDAGPSSASGGMIAFTRDPSGRRASTIGDDCHRRPTLPRFGR